MSGHRGDAAGAVSPPGGASPEPPRPRWMTALALFCFATVPFLIARDLFVPHVRDVEVWFGLELRGAWAWATAPLHWALFALGGRAFWRQRPWIVPAAAAYVFYVAASHLVWGVTSPNGRGLGAGLLQAALLSVPGVLLLCVHRRGQAGRAGA